MENHDELEQQPEQVEEPAAEQPEPQAQDAPSGLQPPFRITGSDGSERGPFQDLETAQETKRQLVANHDGVDFVILDARGES